MQVLNERASRLFCSGEESKVEEGVAIMDEAVIPCLHLMSRDSALSQEDRDAMESIRSHWCCCLGQEMDGEILCISTLFKKSTDLLLILAFNSS